MTSTLADKFCDLKYAGRNPSMAEYSNASPAEKRAIVRRWQEIERAEKLDAAVTPLPKEVLAALDAIVRAES